MVALLKGDWESGGSWDCRVQGSVLMPGTGFFEMAAAALSSLSASPETVLKDLSILSPKLLQEYGKDFSQHLVSCFTECTEGSLMIASAGRQR